jgi:hypothetical protein
LQALSGYRSMRWLYCLRYQAKWRSTSNISGAMALAISDGLFLEKLPQP